MVIKLCQSCAPKGIEELSAWYSDRPCDACSKTGAVTGFSLYTLLGELKKPGELFVAVQRGVYRHDIIGVFETLAAAKAAGAVAIEDERDHYHDIEIAAVTPDVAGERLIGTLLGESGPWPDSKKCFGERPLLAVEWESENAKSSNSTLGALVRPSGINICVTINRAGSSAGTRVMKNED